MFVSDIAKLMERHCAECGKIFIVSCPLEYVYKIRTYSNNAKSNSTDYYCCYTHWKKAKEKKANKSKKNREAYYERLKGKKKNEEEN